MARPPADTAWMSRGLTIQTALGIIDREGIDALSLPRLARELNVKAPSLYHYFADKSGILAAVAREVVAKTVVPRHRPNQHWIDWFTELCVNFRTAVLRHRNAAPILLEHMPRDLLTDVYERAAAQLAAAGVPVEWHVQLLDGLEKLALGATIAEAMQPTSRARVQFAHATPDAHPVLTAANRANRSTARQTFERTVQAYLRGITDALPARNVQQSGPSAQV